MTVMPRAEGTSRHDRHLAATSTPVIARYRRRCASVASMLLGIAFAILANARICAAAGPSARLTYVRSIDAASCPDEAALRKAVASRFGYDPFFPWAKQIVVVHLGREGQRFTAHVELVDESGLSRGSRDLHADDDDCSQIFGATALAISIALDAFAASPSEPPQMLPAPEPVGVAPPPQPPSGMATPAPLLPPAAAESAIPIAAKRAQRTPLALGLDVLGSVGAAPGATAGIGAFISARAKAASLELRLAADASGPMSVGPVGRVETARFAATLAPCAHVRILFACGVGEIGWVQGWGLDLETARSQAAPWIAAGARFGVAMPVSDATTVRIYAEGIIDLDRTRFQLDYYDAWTASLAQGTLAIGFAHRVP